MSVILSREQVPVCLTIAGSDSGGGAGIQADLRTFAFHRVHGTSAITCVTAQNTCGVNRVDALPAASVIAQIEAVEADIGINSLKTGMLLNVEVIGAVAKHLESLVTKQIVVDPVMVSRAGAVLLDPDAIDRIKNDLVPLASILTPNRYEAQILSGQEINTEADLRQAAIAIHRLGCPHILIKGGGFKNHLHSRDLWYDGQFFEILETAPVDTPHTHGTGCTLSAAIAANLALGHSPLASAQKAKQYVTQALKHSLAIGKGQGPVGHWYALLDNI